VAAPKTSEQSNNNLANLETPQKQALPWIVIVAVTLLVLGVSGYLGYNYFFSEKSIENTEPSTGRANTQQSGSQRQTKGSPVVARPIPQGAFAHISAFRAPAEQVIPFVISGDVTSAADLQTYTQKISSSLSTIKQNASFLEVLATKSDGSGASFGEFMYSIQTNLLDQGVFAENFDPDFTFFIYRDSNGYWPGFILKLKPTKNWLYIKDEIARIENATARDAIFLTVPGAPSADGFKDDAVGDVSVRNLNYSNPSASFMYAWIRDRLFISTSRAGFQEALSKL
jgi:hypothetical protein